MNSILQEFLSAQIINVDEDENHEKLIKAASDLEKILTKDKSKLHKFSLIAFDQDVSIIEPSIIEVKNLIIKHWSTFINKCQDTPLNYIRAVILEALQLASKEVKAAGIIWLTASNYIKYYKVNSREAPLLERLLQSTAETYERYSLNLWQLKIDLIDPKFTAKDKDEQQLTVPGIEKEFLVETMKSAAGDSSIKGYNTSAIANNSSYGQSTVVVAWATQYGLIAGEGMSTAFQALADQVNKVISTKASTEHVQNLFTQYSDFIKDFLSKQQSSSVSLNLRNDLLWFKESLYSSLAKSSFRKLNQVVASLLLAIEIAQLVPEFYPVSVEYFIGEICRETSASFESDISFDSILTSINDNKENLGQLSIIKVFPVVTPGRYSLFSFLGDVLKNNLTVEEFINCVGIPLNERTTLSNFSIWLFKELQVQKLIKSK